MKLLKIPVDVIYKILLALKEIYELIRNARKKNETTPDV